MGLSGEEIVVMDSNGGMNLGDKPDFIEAVEEFRGFLESSLVDLKDKIATLKESKRKNREVKVTVKNYVDCQIFVLGRYIKRLQSFDKDVRVRLESYNSQQQQQQQQPGCSLNSSVESEVVVKTTSVSPTPSCSSSSGGSSDNVSEWTYDPEEIKLLKLKADMSKMKLRCKHILDVTDKYCVLKSESTKENNHSSNPQIVKSTVESFLNHISVYSKTYTRRKSHEFNVQTL